MAESRLLGVLGVTRVARVTGLDRTGVEVACAVRPGGHILQISNGKGESFARAARGAVLEAAELWAAERVEPADLVHGSVEEMRARHGDAVLDPGRLGCGGGLTAPSLASGRTRLAWRGARDLVSGGAAFVPAAAVYCPPAGSPSLGPALVRWTSNGMGAHPSRRAALLHALLEVIERDQVARALPDGWTRREVAARMIDPGSLMQSAPRTAARVKAIEQHGFAVYLFDLSPSLRGFLPLPVKRGEGRGEGQARARAPSPSPPAGERGKRLDLGLPVAGAILVDREGGPIPVTAGYACALTAEEALLAALLEAAQSRLTDIHGAREDVRPANAAADRTLAGWCARARPRRRASQMARLPVHVVDPVHLVLGRLRAAGHRRAAAVELAPPGLGIHVFKVIVPGLAVSELL